MSKLGTSGGLDCGGGGRFAVENGGERGNCGVLDGLHRRRRAEQLT